MLWSQKEHGYRLYPVDRYTSHSFGTYIQLLYSTSDMSKAGHQWPDERLEKLGYLALSALYLSRPLRYS